jgi:hypothetical protein
MQGFIDMKDREYTIEDEDNVPEALYNAIESNKRIEVLSVIGWIELEAPDFRVSNTYRIVK